MEQENKTNDLIRNSLLKRISQLEPAERSKVDKVLRKVMRQEEEWKTRENHLHHGQSIKKDVSIFHITHPKSGSQWIYQILLEMAKKRICVPEEKSKHFQIKNITLGNIYPTIYLDRSEFYEVLAPWHTKTSSFQFVYKNNWKKYAKRPELFRKVFVYRDLRDTLVSLYFSMRYSHQMNESIKRHREYLNENTIENGLIFLLHRNLKGSARIQDTWISAKENEKETLYICYEDILLNELASFKKILNHCYIFPTDNHLKQIVAKYSFQKQTGASPGQEDRHRHLRKGIVGDWKNYFTPKLKDEFKKNLNYILIKTGYEHDNTW